MSTGKLRVITIFLFLSLFSVSVFALPCAFDGSVKIDDKLVNPNLISVYFNDTNESVSIQHLPDESTGYYVVFINAGYKYIRFKIADIWADQAEKYCNSSNATTLDLTASSLVDGKPCTYSESCSSGQCINGFCCSTLKTCSDFPNQCGSLSDGCGGTIKCDCTGKTCSYGVCVYSGGGGGGGGTYICTENWTCSAWSECLASQQTRTCTDSNHCGTNQTKPSTTQSCVVSTCTENWSCTDWSACSGGTQTRTCTDSSNCGTTVNKPAETQACEETQTQPVVTTPITPLFLGLTTFDWLTAIIAGIIVALILLFVLRRKKTEVKEKIMLSLP